jgi:hypothetical protein
VRANGAETGSASVTVHGSGLGLAALTAMGRAGQTGCEGTEWESETSVRCMVGGQGTRGTAAALVTAGERGESMTEGYSIDGGSMSAASHNNVAGTGSTSVTVHGTSMGLVT